MPDMSVRRILSVTALQASGGTEMVPAMRRRADRQCSWTIAIRLRQVVFLTDGEIGNEQQLFETITAMRGRSPSAHGQHRLRAQHLSDDARC